MKFQKIHHNSRNIHFQRVPKFVTPVAYVEVPEMTTKRESFLFWGLCLPFWESPIKMHSLSGFWAFLAKLKWWTYVINVAKFNGTLCFPKLRHEMA
jgi:hypothetical protein